VVYIFWCQKDKAKIKIATAMCTRISYTVVGEKGKESNYEKLHILNIKKL
jgi:hypothetical protein